MLPIEAITKRIHDLVKAEFTEYDENRIHLNRTVPLSDEQGEVPGIVVNQGDDTPNNEMQTMDMAGWIASVTITFVIAGTSVEEIALVQRLNLMRQRAHRAIMADRKLGFDWVVETAPGSAQQILSDPSTSSIIKELTTSWASAYMADRRNPDVSYP